MILGKLFNRKPWLTVPDAARHLSKVCAQEVTDADVLHLALYGQLKLSVYFPNGTFAECGAVLNGEPLDSEEAEWKGFSHEIVNLSLNIPDLSKGEPRTHVLDLDLYVGERFANMSGQLAVINGVWDLPMIGGERFDIECLYQNLTGGPPVTRMKAIGVWVESCTGRTLCQLQQLPDQSDYSNNYSPRFRLPDDCVLVIRTDALRDFEQPINRPPAKPSLSTPSSVFVPPKTDAELTDRLKQSEQKLVEAMGQIEAFKQQLGGAQKSIDDLRRIAGDQSAIAPHNTHLMKIAIQVQRDHWGNLDMPPKQAVLLADLAEKYGLSGPEAQAVERVACPINRKK